MAKSSLALEKEKSMIQSAENSDNQSSRPPPSQRTGFPTSTVLYGTGRFVCKRCGERKDHLTRDTIPTCWRCHRIQHEEKWKLELPERLTKMDALQRAEHEHFQLRRELVEQIKLRIGACMECKAKVTELDSSWFEFVKPAPSKPEEKVLTTWQLQQGQVPTEEMEAAIMKRELLCKDCHLTRTKTKKRLRKATRIEALRSPSLPPTAIPTDPKSLPFLSSCYLPSPLTSLSFSIPRIIGVRPANGDSPAVAPAASPTPQGLTATTELKPFPFLPSCYLPPPRSSLSSVPRIIGTATLEATVPSSQAASQPATTTELKPFPLCYLPPPPSLSSSIPESKKQ